MKQNKQALFSEQIHKMVSGYILNNNKISVQDFDGYDAMYRTLDPFVRRKDEIESNPTFSVRIDDTIYEVGVDYRIGRDVLLEIKNSPKKTDSIHTVLSLLLIKTQYPEIKSCCLYNPVKNEFFSF